MPIELTLILPAFNEEKLILNTLITLLDSLRTRYSDFEIIVVDDGSQDHTAQIVKQIATANPEVKLMQQTNQGKGRAIQYGVTKSGGKLIIYTDADLPYTQESLDAVITTLRSGADISIGSRIMPGAKIVGVPLYRTLTGKIFSLIVQFLMFPGIPDTQCGLKGFTNEAAKQIFAHMTIPGFGFDVEILYLARKMGYKIVPVPAQMTHYRKESRVNVFRDSFRMLTDLLHIRWNDMLGRYKA
jgi:dolichyl-phosphate beta-glucosyltransferase